MTYFKLHGNPIPELTIIELPAEELLSNAIAYMAYLFNSIEYVVENWAEKDDYFYDYIELEIDYHQHHYAPQFVDDKTLVKWEVSYVIQALSNYDAVLDSVNDDLYYDAIKKIVSIELLNMIAELYPHLKEECDFRKQDYENN